MKATLSLLATTAAAGAILAKLANAPFLAAVPGALIVASAAALGIAAMMLADYRRNFRPLRLPVAPAARPPVAALPPRHPARTAAYGVRRRAAIVERSAA
jgi:hypothetical protein